MRPPVTLRDYVRVPTVNLRAEALEEALAREVKLSPKTAPMIERIRHVAEQIQHGEGVEQANRGTGKQRGLPWSD